MIDVPGQKPLVREVEMKQWISGPVPCETMDDLPYNLQDQILAALEAKSAEMECPLTIQVVRCDRDPDYQDPTQGWYLHVIATEIVAVPQLPRPH